MMLQKLTVHNNEILVKSKLQDKSEEIFEGMHIVGLMSKTQ